jgi:hypothetical protein
MFTGRENQQIKGIPIRLSLLSAIDEPRKKFSTLHESKQLRITEGRALALRLAVT